MADVESQFYADADADSIAQVIYSCVQDDSPGGTVPFSATNIDKDPNFIAPASGDYRLEGGTSPSFAIDAGDIDLLTPYAVTHHKDLNHDKRIQNSKIDMGCYENGGLHPSDDVHTIIMCWIDESDGGDLGEAYYPNYHDSYTLYYNDYYTFVGKWSAFTKNIKIGVYAPQPLPDPFNSRFMESIFPHDLDLCSFDVLYNYPTGIDVVKRVPVDPAGADDAEKIQAIVDQAMDDFDELRGGSVPVKVILLKDLSGSTPFVYVGDSEDYSNCGVNAFADNLVSTYAELDNNDVEVIKMNSDLEEQWLLDIANEINN